MVGMSNNLQHDALSATSKVEYISPLTAVVDLPFILSTDKKLTIGSPYLYLEGSHITAVNLLDVWDIEPYVQVKVQDRKTGTITILKGSLDYSGDNCLWSLASLDYVQSLTN
jgi:hypothetical protein